jgi:hypothetical protein
MGRISGHDCASAAIKEGSTLIANRWRRTINRRGWREIDHVARGVLRVETAQGIAPWRHNGGLARWCRANARCLCMVTIAVSRSPSVILPCSGCGARTPLRTARNDRTTSG